MNSIYANKNGLNFPIESGAGAGMRGKKKHWIFVFSLRAL
jgi:hypothetical protein